MVALYVDDDESNRRLMAKMFARFRPDHTLVCVSSAGEALEQIRAAPSDLVLLDLGLPDARGEDLMTTIKASYDVPVIIVSGEVREDVRRQLMAKGAGAYLLKPFEPAELFAEVDRLLKPLG